MYRQAPQVLFNVTSAGATLEKLLFPGAGVNACVLPELGSNGVSPITLVSGGAQFGAVFAPDASMPAILLDFAAVGAAGQSLVVEIGKFNAPGALCMPLGSPVTLNTITTGTYVNLNPFTGLVDTVTWRIIDTATIVTTGYGVLGQVVANINGATAAHYSQLKLSMTDSSYYYVIVTNLNALTQALCCWTPSAWATETVNQ